MALFSAPSPNTHLFYLDRPSLRPRLKRPRSKSEKVTTIPVVAEVTPPYRL